MNAPFGRLLTAMITPFGPDGAVELQLPKGGVTLKIRAEEGSLVLPPDLPAPARDGPISTLETKVAGGGPLLSLTGSRAAITIRKP